MKQQLIEAATATAQKAGVQAVTIRELGASVGIKSSSVLYHFKNKDGILQAIATSYTSLFFGRLQDLEDQQADAGARLQGLVDLFAEALQAERMCLCGMLAADSEQLDPHTQATVQQFFQRMQAWVARQLESCGADSSLAPIVVSALEGALLLDKLGAADQRLQAVRQWLLTLCTS